MANIKVMIDGKEYTQEQFRRDLIRMFDTLRKRSSERMGSIHCADMECRDCPLTICIESTDDMESRYYACFKDVYKWAHEHPIATNRDVLKKTFGEDVFNHICARVFEQDWFDQKYEEPSKEPCKEEND